MRTKQLLEIGIPDHLLSLAIECVQKLSAEGNRSKDIKATIAQCAADPTAFAADQHLARLANALQETPFEPGYSACEPISYLTWGSDIDDSSHHQMREACKLPMAVGAALMPDAHVGYGLPIGGVLALENAVVPYAVGVDIACRMKLSVLDAKPSDLSDDFHRFKTAIDNGTQFGVGAAYKTPHDHAVMDNDWSVSRITREHKDKARRQLGTSGSGNHFVEFGILTLTKKDTELNLEAGQYVALMSHSGSRGTGAAVCSTYSSIAQSRLPKRYQQFGRLAWLDMDSEAGQEYWAAMNLMGEYAAANHDVIHRLVSKIAKTTIIAGVENHHNFAWRENHFGRDVIVHRKGATPAAKGVMGVIPGSMATPAFVVRGLGNADSLHSASHGAGRRMSRTKARDQYAFKPIQKDLEKKGVHVLSAGADEVPYVYKDIHDVMAAQMDLVEIVAQFDPKIVKMSDDGKSED
jgi:tRNA-splicing ligase RtcB